MSNSSRFFSEAGADALWEENKLTTSERMMLDELVKQPEPEAPEKPAAKTKK